MNTSAAAPEAFPALPSLQMPVETLRTRHSDAI
jgi:hypothetical protein